MTATDRHSYRGKRWHCAAKVTLLAINPAEFAERYGALPPERMVEHLKRHGASVEGVWLNNVPTESIAGAVLTETHKMGADLIIAGAFGHPRLWEKMMGGVTRDLLGKMDLPILMSYLVWRSVRRNTPPALRS